MRQIIPAGIILILANIIIFGQVYTFDFIGYDDAELVSLNPALEHGLSPEGIRVAFMPYYANWIPLTTITYLVDHAMHGFESGGYHMTNLSFHIVGSLLVLLVFRYLTGQFWMSFGLALLFALHPTRVEAVAWISERKSLVSTPFMIAAIGTYAAYVRSQRVGLYAATAVLLALSLMAKSMAVTLPCVFLLLDVWPLNRYALSDLFSRENRRLATKFLLEKIPFAAIVIASSVMTMLAQDEAGSVASLSQVSAWMRVTNAFYGYGAYLVHAVWPVNLVPFYPHLGDALPLWKPVVAALALVLVTGLVLLQFKRRPYLFVGWFWFLGMLVPVIGLVQIGAQAYADRYMYVPILGLGIMLFGFLADVSGSRPGFGKGAIGVCAIILSIFSWITWTTTSYWQNNIRLFSYVVDVDDENIVGHSILGSTYLASNELDKSQHHLDRVLALDSNNASALRSLGTLYLQKMGIESTDASAVSLRENSATRDELENNIGASYIMRNEHNLAEPHLLRALDLNPNNPVAMTNLAIVRFSQGKRDEALELAENAAKLDPSYENASQFVDFINQN